MPSGGNLPNADPHLRSDNGLLRSTSSPIEYDGAYATASTFFASTAGLTEPPSIPNGMRPGKKIPLTRRAPEGRLAKRYFAVLRL